MQTIENIEKQLFELHISPEICGIFGNKNSNRNDIDIVVVLKEEETLQLTLHSIIDLIEEINKWDVCGSFTPTFELRSFIEEDKIIHLLIYPSVWTFFKLESDPIIKNILLSVKNKKYYSYLNKKITYNLETNKFNILYFDILQKIINSLVLLLNNNLETKTLIERHTLRVLKYSLKWLPLNNAEYLSLLNQCNHLTIINLKEILALYRSICEKLNTNI